MNQNNGKNSLGLDSCFEEHDNPVDLFKKWLSKAEENEVNDPNAVALATSNKNCYVIKLFYHWNVPM